MRYQIPSDARPYDIAGLGNALVDALIQIDDDDILETLGLTRGQMHPVDDARWQEVYNRVAPSGAEVQSGGSCANTVATLGLMGIRSVYCGQVGDDEFGRLYTESITSACGKSGLQHGAGLATGKCLSIISNSDAERTMVTDLGAAVQMQDLGDFAEMIPQSRMLHLTGYLLLGDPMRSRAMEAIDIAKKSGIPVSLDAADPFVIGAVYDVMKELIAEHVDVLFLNASEAEALCGCPAKEAAALLGADIDTVVVKLGREGSIAVHHGVTYRAGIHTVDAQDTTGAGDAYAAGFLYGLLEGWSPDRAADLGSRVASLAVAQLGAVVRSRDVLKQAIDQSR